MDCFASILRTIFRDIIYTRFVNRSKFYRLYLEAVQVVQRGTPEIRYL